MAEIRIEQLQFTYAGREIPALKDLSLHLESGTFAVLAGASGSGKSTLLRQLKPVLTPAGRREGRILIDGAPIESLSPKAQAGRIGFLLQNPVHQCVAESVWQELAFGLENLGMPTADIRMRVAEVASYFGIQHWFDKSISTLSGGQLQLLSLGAVVAMQPEVLLLDEPLAQLDPLAAEQFIGTLRKLNRELGMTVVVCEHRLEGLLPEADRLIVLEQGGVLCDDTPARAAGLLQGHPMFGALPVAAQVGALLGKRELPLTVRAGRQLLEQAPAPRQIPAPAVRQRGEVCLQAKGLCMRYAKGAPDILRELSLTLHRGEVYALLGGNGAGKSTLLQVLGGVRKAYAGRVKYPDALRTALLPQDVQTLFCRETVEEELMDMGGSKQQAAEMAALWRLDGLLQQHPYDLSGGEQQRLALAKLWLQDPDLLLLDEPTKGMEQAMKVHFAALLATAAAAGKTVLLSSHDIEFCAAYAHRCGMLFQGELTAEGDAHTFFANHLFYTTAASRMARGSCPEAVTLADIRAAWGGVL